MDDRAKYHDYDKDPFCISAYSNANRPHLKFEVRVKLSGKWERRFFENERRAKAYVSLRRIELHNNGKEGVMFPAELRVAAQWAADQLLPFGRTIHDAVEFYLKYLRTERGSVPVRQAVGELIANRTAAGMSKVYLHDLRYRLGRFVATFGDRSVASVTTGEIVKWLESLGVGPVTRNTFRRDARTLFSFCIEHGYCTDNPVASKITLAKERPKEVAVLSVEECRKLLANSSPELVPHQAIALFAGLRPSEIRNLDWSNIDFEDALITVRSEKTGRKRHVRMQANLVAWLKPYRKSEGRIVEPQNFGKSREADRDAAGLTEWPVNCLRHSFGSYHLAQFRDVNALACEMGNSPQIVEKHYRQAVRPKEAHRYWAITPVTVQDQERKIVARIG